MPRKKTKKNEQLDINTDFSDFDFFIRTEKDLQKEKKDKRLRLISLSLALYAVIAALIITFTGDISLPFIDNDQEARLINLEKEITSLNQTIEALEESFDNIPSLARLETKIISVEKKQKAIEETILDDADKALTSRLLRDQQKTLKENMDDLKASQLGLNKKVDVLILSPVIVGLLGLFLNWLKKTFFDKKKIEI